MLIGVVSDTHGHLAYAREAVSALAQHDVELVLHCGDIGGPGIVPLFDRWPTHFVFGNCDHDEARLQREIEAAEQTCHGRFGTVEPAGCRIAFLHGDDSHQFRETLAEDEWDLVCYGHTHVAEQHRQGDTLVLNPGALYRAQPHSLAVVELSRLDVSFVNL